MIVDIIIIAVIVISIIAGKHKGLTVCLVNILSFLVALILAIMLCHPVENSIINGTDIDDKMASDIKSNIQINADGVKISDNSTMPTIIQNYVNSTVENVNQGADDIAEKVSRQLAEEVIVGISFVGIFVAVRLVLLVVKLVSKIITKLPIIKQADKIGGAICGAVEGVVLVFAVFAVLSIASPALENTGILKEVNKSNIGKYVYNNNFILEKIYKK